MSREIDKLMINKIYHPRVQLSDYARSIVMVYDEFL